MSKNAIKIISLLNEFLSEIGDLNNINSYPIHQDTKLKYNFILEDGNKVDVNFTLLTHLEVSRIEIPPIIDTSKTDYYFNLGYSIRGISSQMKKSNVSELIRILKTILEIVKKFQSNFPNSSILIFEENKDESLGLTRGQKTPLYKSIISQNLPADYISREVTSNGIYGIIISPK